MQRLAMVLAVAAAAMAPSCHKDEGSGAGACTRARCDVLDEICGLTVSGMPDLRLCDQKVGPRPAAFDQLKYCPAACEATGSGRVIACIVGQLGDASTADRCPEAVVKCGAGADTLDRACVSACADARATCEGLCQSATFEECADCSARCGLQEGRCVRACPAAM